MAQDLFPGDNGFLKIFFFLQILYTETEADSKRVNVSVVIFLSLHRFRGCVCSSTAGQN